MDDRTPQAFRVVASGDVVEVIAKPHPFGWTVRDAVADARGVAGAVSRQPVYLTPRAAVVAFAATDLDGVEEIRGPGEATTAEALDAAVSGYRRGVAARVLDALTEARDACQGIVRRQGDWPSSGCGVQCVEAIDDMIAGKVIQ